MLVTRGYTFTFCITQKVTKTLVTPYPLKGGLEKIFLSKRWRNSCCSPFQGVGGQNKQSCEHTLPQIPGYSLIPVKYSFGLSKG